MLLSVNGAMLSEYARTCMFDCSREVDSTHSTSSRCSMLPHRDVLSSRVTAKLRVIVNYSCDMITGTIDDLCSDWIV